MKQNKNEMHICACSTKEFAKPCEEDIYGRCYHCVRNMVLPQTEEVQEKCKCGFNTPKYVQNGFDVMCEICRLPAALHQGFSEKPVQDSVQAETVEWKELLEKYWNEEKQCFEDYVDIVDIKSLVRRAQSELYVECSDRQLNKIACFVYIENK